MLRYQLLITTMLIAMSSAGCAFIAGKDDSGFMTPAQSGETAATFDAMVELMLEGADDPQFTPRNQLDRIQERGHAAQEN